MSREPRERAFDELARLSARGTLSRGKALRLMGAALVGGVLASIPGVALAAPCSPGFTSCGSNCCDSTQACERRGGAPRCITPTAGCPHGCPQNMRCCNVGGFGICCGNNQGCSAFPGVPSSIMCQ